VHRVAVEAIDVAAARNKRGMSPSRIRPNFRNQRRRPAEPGTKAPPAARPRPCTTQGHRQGAEGR
jgi:hypothetical protein